MDKIKEKIDMAMKEGLFDKSFQEEYNKVFDSYGNYSFPTDFSNSEENTLVSTLLFNDIEVPKTN